jgi:electron transport complex protein RnfD
MEFTTDNLSNQIDNHKIAAEMRQVLYALLPGIVMMLWFLGWGVLSNIILTLSFALGFEALMLKLRQRPVLPFLSDYSAIVTATLLALTLPAYAPWWLLLVAAFFAIVIAKHLYGGLGYNPFNPAMVGYAVVLISFPVDMVNWFTPTAFNMGQIGLSDTFALVFKGAASLPEWDAMTMATPLDTLKTGLRMDTPINEINQSPTFGVLAGKGWEWISLGYLIGGVWLIYRKIISWHIPTAFLTTLILLSGVFWLIDSSFYSSPLLHLLAGGTMLGAFFIATDPITASTTPQGKLIYAALIGFFVYVIRVWGSAYPDGVAFSVLIMNMAVPLIDYYTQPKTFGTPP